MKFIKYFETAQERQSCIDTYKYLSYTDEDKVVNIHPYDYSKNYLTFIAKSNGTFNFSGSSSGSTANVIQYSTNNGETWSEALSSATVNVNSGDKVLWKGEMTPITVGPSYNPYKMIGGFSEGTANFDAKGNIMSLLYGDNFIEQTSLSDQTYTFYKLFYNSKIVDASNLILPATTLTNNCYSNMFENCSDLTTAPKLPATTLAKSCYNNMFSNCTSLTTAPLLQTTILAERCYSNMFYYCTSLTSAPQLPATTLATGCYQSMFGNCTSLIIAPSLPATTLADSCYGSMFSNCTSLANSPELPATTLASYCYQAMFSRCTSLTKSPELPATTLVLMCYSNMFMNCTNLNNITMLATDISASDCLIQWVYAVADSGTFVKAASMTTLPSGTSGIPEGWTVQDDI